MTIANRGSICLFSQLWRNGDILTGIDGRSIHSIDDALSLYNGLKNSDGLSLQINRRGRPYAMNYVIR
jgi:general secretion pathway protein C